MKLYSYFRSSAAFRVRIALNLKGLEADYVPVNLLKAEQKAPPYLTLNPAGMVPALELDSGEVLIQSVAMLEWLEETCPIPPLLPEDPLARARVRSVVNLVAADIHPICNLAVTNYLKDKHRATQADVVDWYHAWMHRGFTAIEDLIRESAGPFCFGDQVTLADLCLVPQVYNARRFHIPLDAFPTIDRVSNHCMALDAFARAAPEQQPDWTQ